MVKWIKITENQYFGFWFLGLLFFAVQEIPYMIMPLMKLNTNPIMEMTDKSVFLNVCEKALGSLCIALMLFAVNDRVSIFNLDSKRDVITFSLVMAVLLLNFVGWGLYFKGFQSTVVMMAFLVALPPLYYAFIGLWRSNTVLFITAWLFLGAHIMNVWNNLK